MTTLQRLTKNLDTEDLMPTYEFLCDSFIGNTDYWSYIEAKKPDGTERHLMFRLTGRKYNTEITDKRYGLGLVINLHTWRFLHHAKHLHWFAQKDTSSLATLMAIPCSKAGFVKTSAYPQYLAQNFILCTSYSTKANIRP
ncbi:hypothetical protein PEC302107_15950 [Pectobacterium araliae]|uniref:Uncharacterized protein n=1 Tax=Pectobacterium araliae TaxID=3073862 RepID=A0AAN0KBA4_9GAMM|nr:hypothetical protein PEC302110_25580 [Pectobacterium sp. MAFF 302110]GKW19866.1 hypothetical protein PEC302107_15950 [Pectobacterium carotovorum subsp. carotovorum]